MMLVAALLAFGAALLCLAVGYLVGLRTGKDSRDNLRDLNRLFAKEVATLRAHRPPAAAGDSGTAAGLREVLQEMLLPLVRREQLSLDMSQLDAGPSAHRNLTATLDQMAERGNFAAVLLSDAQGWRVAASSATQDPERLGVTASLLLLLADRLARDGSPAPLSLMLYDAANTTTLCRIFTVGSQKMTLTVVASGAQLTPAAIDPALVKLTAILMNQKDGRSEAT